MHVSLTPAGIGWSLLSIVSALAVSAGYYMPYWIVDGQFCMQNQPSIMETGPNNSNAHGGEKVCTNTSFGPFRRCGYAHSSSLITPDCGRYSKFELIPSIWWQISTLILGVGTGAALLIALVTIPGCCFDSILSRSSARLLGLFQFVAALLCSVGCCLFPLGWDNPEVVETCHNSARMYHLGRCSLGWCSYSTVGGALCLFICSSLSYIAAYPIDEMSRASYSQKVITRPTTAENSHYNAYGGGMTSNGSLPNPSVPIGSPLHNGGFHNGTANGGNYYSREGIPIAV